MGKANNYNYGVVLDAGSSGTRVYVYRWLRDEIARQGGTLLSKTLPLLETEDDWTKKVHPGVSTYAENPGLIGPDHLKNLLDHALSVVPTEAVRETPVFLLATAGMRLLPDFQRNALLKSICSYIRTETRFLLPDCDVHVQVISGETEGLYGWIAANYLLGGFDEPEAHDHGKGHHTYGFLDLGGASAQIAFAPNSTEAEKHANDLKLVRFRTVDGSTQEHRVFVATWLGFGVNEARKRYLQALMESFGTSEIMDPCLPPGYETLLDAKTMLPASDGSFPETHISGAGLFDECLKRTYPLLEKDAPCLDKPCLVNGQHVPAIDFDVNHFIGISEYWHTTHEIFETAHNDKSYDFHTYQARVKEFCERPWSTTKAEIATKLYGSKVDEQAAYQVCFKASWLINLLHDGIGVPRIGLETITGTHNGTKEVLDNAKKKGYIDPFQAVNKIKSTEVSWTMGKMALYASARIAPADDSETNFYPVGFGSNIPGNPIPADWRYPDGGSSQPIQPKPNSDTTAPIPIDYDPIGDQGSSHLLDSDPSRRIPGFLVFLVIIIIVVFYLLRRDRRARFLTRYLPYISSPGGRKPSFPNSNTMMQGRFRISCLLNRLLHPLRRSSGGDDDRTMEEGSASTTRLYDPTDFELSDFPNDSDDDDSSIVTGQGGRPLSTRSRTPRPKLSVSQSAQSGGGGGGGAFSHHAGHHHHHHLLRPDAVDRRGLAVRTESRERLGGLGGGRRSRNSSVSPTRLRAVDG